MASGALFGGQASRSQSKNLVEFKAGKMFMKGRMVHADKRKGLLYVYQSEDSLIHFCWKERSKAKPEPQDDLIIFPDDAEFKSVPKCTTGRVFVLKFKASNDKKLIFWMQEPKADKDEDLCRKVNESLNNPPAPGSTRSGGGGGGGLGGLPAELAAGLGGGSDLQSMLGNMSQQELMQLLGGMGVGGLGGLSALMGGRPSSAQSDSAPPSRVQSSPGPRAATTDSSATPTAPRPVTAAVLPSQDTPATGGATTAAAAAPTSGASSSASGAIQLSDLQNILSGMGVDGEKEAIDLSKAVTPEVMIPILANAEIQQRLLPFLPEGETLPKTEGELRNTVTSPQFQQAMNSFSAALASGQLGPLMGQFGLGEDVALAATQGDVEAFAKAMQATLKEKQDSEDTEMKDDEKKV